MLQAAVLSKYTAGESKVQIAQDLGMHRNTVASILADSEIQQIVMEGRSACVQRIPKSIKVIDQRLRKGSETAALAILRGTNVLMNQQVTANQTNIVANTWVMMREQRKAEAAQVIEATCESSDTPKSSST